MRRFTFRDVALVLITAIITVLLFKGWYWWHTPKFDTPYQAVLLTNNTVYIGKMEGLGTNYPVMHDVFYIQTKVNPETKQATNMLVRRDTTWHSPSYMVLDERQIVMIEPVGQNSKAAEMLNQAINSHSK